MSSLSSVTNNQLTCTESQGSHNVIVPRLQGITNELFARWIYLERYCNGETQTYSKFSTYSEVPAEYQPKSANESFLAPRYKVPVAKARVLTANPTAGLLEKYVAEGFVRFYVHPAVDRLERVPMMSEMIEHEPDEKLQVTPTSSTRSVFVLSDGIDHCIKSTLPFKISRFIRSLGPESVAHSNAVSKDLEAINHPKFAFLRETIGISFKGKDEELGLGFIVREMKPYPHIAEKRMLIPFFALYGKDIKDETQAPLLVRMISYSQENPKKYVLNHLFFPVISCFLEAFTKRGILPESHGQNTLLEVDDQMRPQRIVHRDLQELIDPNVRKSQGLSLEGFHPGQIIPEPNEDEPKGSSHSLIYDKSIGRLLFNYLAELVEKQYQIPQVKLQRKCQQHFTSLLPNFTDHFPPSVYKYADTPKPDYPNTYALIDTGEPPVWRPAKIKE